MSKPETSDTAKSAALRPETFFSAPPPRASPTKLPKTAAQYKLQHPTAIGPLNIADLPGRKAPKRKRGSRGGKRVKAFQKKKWGEAIKSGGPSLPDIDKLVRPEIPAGHVENPNRLPWDVPEIFYVGTSESRREAGLIPWAAYDLPDFSAFPDI